MGASFDPAFGVSRDLGCCILDPGIRHSNKRCEITVQDLVSQYLHVYSCYSTATVYSSTRSGRVTSSTLPTVMRHLHKTAHK